MIQHTVSTYSGLFEAHITVDLCGKKEKEMFQSLCEQLQVKPIQIELSGGDVSGQPMTCSRHEGDFSAVYQQVLELAETINTHFTVIRTKIEAYPLNKGIPKNNKEAEKHSDKNYFEHHIKLLLSERQPMLPLLKICEKYKAHLSKNAFKELSHGVFENFITVRAYQAGREEARARFQALEDALKNAQFTLLKSVTEYCVYDSNVGLDNNCLELTPACMVCETPCK